MTESRNSLLDHPSWRPHCAMRVGLLKGKSGDAATPDHAYAVSSSTLRSAASARAARPQHRSIDSQQHGNDHPRECTHRATGSAIGAIASSRQARSAAATAGSQCRLGDILLCEGRASEAREIYAAAVATCERAVAEFGETGDRARTLFALRSRQADALLAAQQRDQAREMYETSLAASQRVVAEFGPTAQRLRDVSVVQYRLGRTAKQRAAGAGARTL